MKKKNYNSIIVLKSLLNGNSIELDGLKYEVSPDNSKILIDVGNYHVITHITLNGFIELCENLPDDQIAIIAGNNALNSMNKKRK